MKGSKELYQQILSTGETVKNEMPTRMLCAQKKHVQESPAKSGKEKIESFERRRIPKDWTDR